MIFKRLTVLSLMFSFVLLGANISFAQMDEEAPSYSKMLAFIDDGGMTREIELPLKHTSVEANITGYISKVDVEQEYVNNFEEAIEAVYMFPLPENAAIHSMEMLIGEKVIKGVIKEREERNNKRQQKKSFSRFVIDFALRVNFEFCIYQI